MYSILSILFKVKKTFDEKMSTKQINEPSELAYEDAVKMYTKM